MKDEIYEMYVSGINEAGMPFQRSIFCYTCGHCSNIISLREDRSRPRQKCLSCSRLICEKSEICRKHCTPIHKLADDHFETKGDWARYIPAIMQGVTSMKEAEERQLILPPGKEF